MAPFNWLFPSTPREFPGRRALKISLRAVHVLFAGVLTAAFLFDVESAIRDPWLAGTLVSGLLILVLDLHESGVFLLQIRGYTVLAKLAVLAGLSHLPWPGWVLAGIVVLSVVISHAPSAVRYFVPLGGKRFVGARTKG